MLKDLTSHQVRYTLFQAAHVRSSICQELLRAVQVCLRLLQVFLRMSGVNSTSSRHGKPLCVRKFWVCTEVNAPRASTNGLVLARPGADGRSTARLAMPVACSPNERYNTSCSLKRWRHKCRPRWTRTDTNSDDVRRSVQRTRACRSSGQKTAKQASETA